MAEDNGEDGEEENPFELYAPYLDKMIVDTNLAQLEGLECLTAYIKCAPDIKKVVHSLHGTLLDKVQINKANFRDATIKVFIAIMKRQSNSEIWPGLIMRIKGKNAKTA